MMKEGAVTECTQQAAKVLVQGSHYIWSNFPLLFPFFMFIQVILLFLKQELDKGRRDLDKRREKT